MKNNKNNQIRFFKSNLYKILENTKDFEDNFFDLYTTNIFKKNFNFDEYQCLQSHIIDLTYCVLIITCNNFSFPISYTCYLFIFVY